IKRPTLYERSAEYPGAGARSVDRRAALERFRDRAEGDPFERVAQSARARSVAQDDHARLVDVAVNDVVVFTHKVHQVASARAEIAQQVHVTIGGVYVSSGPQIGDRPLGQRARQAGGLNRLDVPAGWVSAAGKHNPAAAGAPLEDVDLGHNLLVRFLAFCV